MDKKSKLITAGLCALALGICLIYFGKDGTIGSTSSSTDDKMVIFGTIILVAGVASTSIGFTSKGN